MPAKKLISAEPLSEQAPSELQAFEVASSITFVVARAVEITLAAFLSTVIVKGSVVQLPTLPLVVLVSTLRVFT